MIGSVIHDQRNKKGPCWSLVYDHLGISAQDRTGVAYRGMLALKADMQ